MFYRCLNQNNIVFLLGERWGCYGLLGSLVANIFSWYRQFLSIWFSLQISHKDLWRIFLINKYIRLGKSDTILMDINLDIKMRCKYTKECHFIDILIKGFDGVSKNQNWTKEVNEYCIYDWKLVETCFNISITSS